MRRRAVAFAVAFVLTAGAGAVHAVPGRAAPPKPGELTETTRLPDRRSVVIGDRFYSVSTEDGLYPAAGWHTAGEMGGMWTPPLKLLDGVWFGLGGSWLGGQAKAESFTAGHGYTRIRYDTGGVRVDRTDVAPDGVRAGLIGLTLTSATARTVRLDVDAHSELMSAYPWGSTTPDQQANNLPDTGAYDGGSLVFREQGTPKVANAPAHDFAAIVAADRRPVAHQLGAGHRGPQDPPVICPATGTTPQRCDDSSFGKGTGGRLSYDVRLPAGHGTTVWLAVAGSDHGTAEARAALGAALRDPAGLLARKIAARRSVAANTVVDLPGDRLLQQSVEWSKQNLADSVQQAGDLRLRATEEGTLYPPVKGTLAKARWIGAGWPDYPWIFGTDGEFTAFATVAAGQFDAIEDHLRTLRDVSDVVNDRSGKVVHEVVSDGSVYFGANDEKGNTDETAKYPSAAALVWRWTGDTVLPRRRVRLHGAEHALRGRRTRRRRRRLARGARQRRAARHGRGEARQHGLHRARPVRPGRHGAGQGRPGHRLVGDDARRRPAPRASTRRGGTAATRTSSPTPWTIRPTPRTTTRRSSSGTGSA